MQKFSKILVLFTLSLLSIGLKARDGYAPNVTEKDFVAYLFTYFHGNRVEEEQICFAVSLDGYHFKALNNDKPVIDSKTISETGGT